MRNRSGICPRIPKIRGKKNKRRAECKISDVTTEGFRLRTFNKNYYIVREKYPWFKDATQREIQSVVFFPCWHDDPSDCSCDGDIFHWVMLDVILTTRCIEHPERFLRATSVRGVQRLDLFDKERKRVEEQNEWERQVRYARENNLPIPPHPFIDFSLVR